MSLDTVEFGRLAGIPKHFINGFNEPLNVAAIAESAMPFLAVVSAAHCANAGRGEECEYQDGERCPLFRAMRPMILEQFYLLISCFGVFNIYTQPDVCGRRVLIYEGVAKIDRVDGDGNITHEQFGYREVIEALEDFTVSFKLPTFVVKEHILLSM